MTKIKKVVFPVAGLGTRFLPATKSIPKEMLPVVDRPLMQYAIDEAVEAGIETIVFVNSQGKKAIEDHFDRMPDLENELKAKNKTDQLAELDNILPSYVKCVSVRQVQALGLGHAVLCAKPIVDNEPFAVMLPDDLIYSENKGVLKQMVEQYEKTGASIIAVEAVPIDKTHLYGVVSGDEFENGLMKLNAIVEKPPQGTAPSNLSVVGRYVLNGSITQFLENTKPGSGGEIQLTDAIAEQIKNETVYAYQFDGIRYDCGSKFGYLQANVEFALRRYEFAKDMKDYLENLNFKEFTIK